MGWAKLHPAPDTAVPISEALAQFNSPAIYMYIYRYTVIGVGSNIWCRS